MKILYKQSNNQSDINLQFTDDFKINKCYLKKISFKDNSKLTTKKSHHHTGFEIHMINEGFQTYEINGQEFKVSDGSFLLIPPHIQHRSINSTNMILKHSLTFDFPASGCIHNNIILSRIPQRINDNIKFINSEKEYNKKTSLFLIENAVFEIIVLMLRMAEYAETENVDTNSTIDLRIALAKQYIADNIKESLRISEISNYCHISTKQLTRIFSETENITPSQYIQKQRALYIENLLENTDLSLKDISEMMNFQNEYYFNAFFKKHFGMPPGEYRKMIK